MSYARSSILQKEPLVWNYSRMDLLKLLMTLLSYGELWLSYSILLYDCFDTTHCKGQAHSRYVSMLYLFGFGT